MIDWQQAIRAVTAGYDLQILGDIIRDNIVDGYRVRCRFIDDPPWKPGTRCRIVVIPWVDLGLSYEALGEHICQCFDKLRDERDAERAEIARIEREVAARAQWSPYPVGNGQP